MVESVGGLKMVRRSNRSRLWRTAYHEAGHAVIAYTAHRPIKEVSIVPVNGESLGHCASKPLTDKSIQEGAPGFMWFDTAEENAIRRKAERDAMCSLAGRIAEEEFVGQTTTRTKIGGSCDAHDVYGILECLAWGDELDAYVGWLWERTKAMLFWQPHWFAVERLAALLVERRRISGRLARATIRKAWQDSFEEARAQAR